MKTISFYSYKGGVGRTLALANIAKRLFEFNKKVCIIDFDLEAPGIPSKFISELKDTQIQKGLVDYLFEYSVEGRIPSDIKSYSIKLSLQSTRFTKGEITIIPSGDTDDSTYWKKLSQINWYELLYEDENGLSFFLDLKEKIKKEVNPDYLLIDTRTGISEMSGISISLLADEVVVIAANNKENLYGAKKIIELLNNRKNIVTESEIKVTFVLSRVPFTRSPNDLTKEEFLIKNIAKRFNKIYNEPILVLHSDRDLEENEKLKISSLDDGEEKSAFQIVDDYLKLFDKLIVKDLAKDEIEKFENIKKANILFEKALQEEVLEKKGLLLNEAIKLNNEDPRFFYERIELCSRMNNLEQQYEDISAILQLDQQNQDALNYLNQYYIKKGDYDKARQVANDILKVIDDKSDGYFILGYTYGESGDLDMAEAQYIKSLEINPYSHISLNNLANLYKEKGQLEEAHDIIFKALEVKPTNPVSLVTLAEIYLARGFGKDFLHSLELALINDTNNTLEIKSMKKEVIDSSPTIEIAFKKLVTKYGYSYD